MNVPRSVYYNGFFEPTFRRMTFPEKTTQKGDLGSIGDTACQDRSHQTCHPGSGCVWTGVKCTDNKNLASLSPYWFYRVQYMSYIAPKPGNSGSRKKKQKKKRSKKKPR